MEFVSFVWDCPCVVVIPLKLAVLAGDNQMVPAPVDMDLIRRLQPFELFHKKPQFQIICQNLLLCRSEEQCPLRVKSDRAD